MNTCKKVYNSAKHDMNISMETVSIWSFEECLNHYENPSTKGRHQVRTSIDPVSLTHVDDREERDDSFHDHGYDTSNINVEQFLASNEKYSISSPRNCRQETRDTRRPEKVSFDLAKPRSIVGQIGSRLRECLAPYNQTNSPPRVNVPVVCINDWSIDQSSMTNKQNSKGSSFQFINHKLENKKLN